MNNVYLDVLFLINFLTDYITLLCTAKVSHAAIYRIRLIIASVIGGIYSCLCMYYVFSWLAFPLAKLCLAYFLCFIAFHNEPHMLRCFIYFLVISSVFGGLLTPFVSKSQYGAYMNINIKALIIAFAVIYFILSHLFAKTDRQTSQSYHQAEISLRNQTVQLTVLRDTGNELYDPMSNLPVMIVEKDILTQLLPELDTTKEEENIYDTFCRLNSMEDLCGKFRLIPYQTISDKNVLIGFVPDRLYIDKQAHNMVIAYTYHTLSAKKDYQGIY